MRTADQHGLYLAEAVEHKRSKGWRACWGKFQCFTSSRKRDRNRNNLLSAASAANADGIANIQISDAVGYSTSLSPLVHAPPSSPASLSYTENLPSSAALLTLFPLKSMDELCSSATARPDSSFRGLDPALVTPPLHSTLTTEPTTPLSTAPFTPPPELAHLTNPSSPEVPFAELIPSSLKYECGDHVCDRSAAGSSEVGFRFLSEDSGTVGEARERQFPSLSQGVTSFQDNEGSVSISSLLERTSPFGFNQVISADAYGHCSPKLLYKKEAPNDAAHQEPSEAMKISVKLPSDARWKEAQTKNRDLKSYLNESSHQTSESQSPIKVIEDGDRVRENQDSEVTYLKASIIWPPVIRNKDQIPTQTSQPFLLCAAIQRGTLMARKSLRNVPLVVSLIQSVEHYLKP
ncbi:hypothetical protein KP509_20G046400 [Ceratopteris richardii]|uniref:Uncharacterized protein n=1 Tax=Ceratopteris richardii TaxID=49495 RepID=A0A8T2SI27_CERRI|nr:hypothetical protein KP509_20G046400 [Ceratopteris richardii]